MPLGDIDYPFVFHNGKLYNRAGYEATSSSLLRATAPSVADLQNTRRVPGAVPVVLPTPYSSVGPTMVHPSYVYVDGGWNGYEYWMAVTPYPNNDSTYENPCILCSSDGLNWIVPPGVTNPVIPWTGVVNDYNRDCHLLQDPTDPTRQIMIYLERDTAVTAKNYLFAVVSYDGWKTRSTPVQLWFGAIGTGVAANQGDMAAPSLWYDKANAKWVILGHNLDAAAHPFPLRKITSNTLLSGWDTLPVAVTFPIAYSGRDWWHSHWAYDDSTGNVYGLVQDNPNSAGSPGNIYLAWSTDGANTFTSRAIDLPGNWYRPTFAMRRANDGSQYMDCYFNTLLNTVTYRVQIKFDANAYNLAPTATDIQAAISSYSSGSGTYLADNCTRADSAVAPGSPNVGGPYTVPSGIFGISTNRLYGVNTGGNNKLLTPSFGRNYRFIARLAVVGTQAWFHFGARDTNNGYRFGFNTTSTYRLQKLVAGAVDAAFGDNAMGPAPTAGDVFDVIKIGAQYTIRCRGQFICEFTDSTYALDGVLCGLQTSGASLTYFDAVWGRSYSSAT